MAQSSSVPGQAGADESSALLPAPGDTDIQRALLDMGRHSNGLYVPLRKTPHDNQYPDSWLVVILLRAPTHAQAP